MMGKKEKERKKKNASLTLVYLQFKSVFRHRQGHCHRDTPTSLVMAWRTIPTISKAAGDAAHVILMFYSCQSYYGIQRLRSKSALAEIFHIIPTSLPSSIWLSRMTERRRQPPSAQPCWIIKTEDFKEVSAQKRKGIGESSTHPLSVCGVLKAVSSHLPIWLRYREVFGWH